MDLRTKICVWVILIGLTNFIAYTIGYSVVGGESVRGQVIEDPATKKRDYFLDTGREVHRDTFIYIGVHSISIWPTVAAVMLAMLTLAKDRIADSMRSAMMRGRSFCTVLAVLITISTAGLTFQFIREFVGKLWRPDQQELKLNKDRNMSAPSKEKPATNPADAKSSS